MYSFSDNLCTTTCICVRKIEPIRAYLSPIPMERRFDVQTNDTRVTNMIIVDGNVLVSILDSQGVARPGNTIINEGEIEP